MSKLRQSINESRSFLKKVKTHKKLALLVVGEKDSIQFTLGSIVDRQGLSWPYFNTIVDALIDGSTKDLVNYTRYQHMMKLKRTIRYRIGGDLEDDGALSKMIDSTERLSQAVKHYFDSQKENDMDSTDTEYGMVFELSFAPDKKDTPKAVGVDSPPQACKSSSLPLIKSKPTYDDEDDDGVRVWGSTSLEQEEGAALEKKIRYSYITNEMVDVGDDEKDPEYLIREEIRTGYNSSRWKYSWDLTCYFTKTYRCQLTVMGVLAVTACVTYAGYRHAILVTTSNDKMDKSKPRATYSVLGLLGVLRNTMTSTKR